MTKTYKRTVTVTSAKRARNSVNGNPSYVLETDDGQFRTQSDTSAAYGLENPPGDGGLPIDAPVVLLTTASGRVFGWEVPA